MVGRWFLAASLAAVALILPGLALAAGEVNLYTARHYDTDEALYTDFTKATGIRVNRIEAGPDQLVERMAAEGANSPADIFITVEAGRIERANALGLLQPVESKALSDAIPAYLRDPEGYWFGISLRARVLVYAKDRVKPAELSTYEALADPKWKGRIVVRSSTNVYNQSLTGAVLATLGPEKTLDWVRGLVANFARPPRGGDTDQIKAVAAGEGDVAIVNTYYFANMVRSQKPEDRAIVDKLALFFPNQGDRGTHVNISGAGIAKHAPHRAEALKFLEYLVSASAQHYFADGNSEYPVVKGVKLPAVLETFGEFRQDQLNAGVFARNNAEALKLMDQGGWK